MECLVSNEREKRPYFRILTGKWNLCNMYWRDMVTAIHKFDF